MGRERKGGRGEEGKRRKGRGEEREGKGISLCRLDLPLQLISNCISS